MRTAPRGVVLPVPPEMPDDAGDAVDDDDESYT
jgi:hypothetical protein